MIIFFLFLGLVLLIIGVITLCSQEFTLSKNSFYKYGLIDSILKALLGEKVLKHKFTGFTANIIGLLLILGGIAFVYQAYYIYKTGISPI